MSETKKNQKNLPSYKSPPVNEVICGMRFQAPDKLRIPHIGFLWNKFRADYPVLQHAQQVVSAKGEILLDTATGVPLPRIWFINDSDDQLIQFQLDRFYFNWRRKKNDYPRYNYIIKNFEFTYKAVVDFFNEFGLGELKPIEYELSYINHIPKGEGWNTIDDIPNIFTDFIWKNSTKRFLKTVEKISWNAEFLLPEQKGHLNVGLKQATRIEDKMPLLIFELKTRGLEDTFTNKSMRAWFDLAHEWIVRGFTDLTTPKIQKIWGKEEDV